LEKIDPQEETTSKLNQNIFSQNTHKLPLPVRKYPKDVGSQHQTQAFGNSLYKTNKERGKPCCLAKVSHVLLMKPSFLEGMLASPGGSMFP